MPEKHPCPCCGYLVFAEPPGSYDICPICFWEDDIVQLGFPFMAGGANKLSLYESQQNFLTQAVSDLRFVQNVRAPTDADARDAEWRPLDPSRDPYLRWATPADYEKWKTAPDRVGLYWWRPDYWLTKSENA